MKKSANEKEIEKLKNRSKNLRRKKWTFKGKNAI